MEPAKKEENPSNHQHHEHHHHHNHCSNNNITDNNKGYINYTPVGSGTFGTVFQAQMEQSKQIVAIKKVFQDKRYKNRELQIMKELNHPNVVKLLDFFYTPGDKEDELYLNCVMNFFPENLSKIIRANYNKHEQMDMFLVKLYSFQMLNALSYIHSIGICHRDIKPTNVLINLTDHSLALCDFGSAKRLEKGKANIAYICSRYYRAPELIFGATDYSCQIDVWSAGCIIAELILGRPLFPGENSSDQLVEIIKVLGTPTKEQILAMNPNYKEQKFPNINPYPWEKVFKRRVVNNLYLDLISKLLVYDPNARLTPMKALCHPFFDEIRSPNLQMLGKSVPKDLLYFTNDQIKSDPESAKYLISNTMSKDGNE